MICKPDFDNLQQVCSSQLAASLSFATCSKSAVRNLQQVCRSQLAASLQFASCSKSAGRNLQQVSSSQLAASLLTTCSRLVVIKPEQAMRTHPDISLMIATCSKSAADLLQVARFWLCNFKQNKAIWLLRGSTATLLNISCQRMKTQYVIYPISSGTISRTERL